MLLEFLETGMVCARRQGSISANINAGLIDSFRLGRTLLLEVCDVRRPLSQNSILMKHSQLQVNRNVYNPFCLASRYKLSIKTRTRLASGIRHLSKKETQSFTNRGAYKTTPDSWKTESTKTSFISIYLICIFIWSVFSSQ